MRSRIWGRIAAGALLATAGLGAFAQVLMPQAPGTATDIEDIRDIRGPIPVPGSSSWLLLAIALLLLAMVTIAFWYRKRRRKNVQSRPAYELALERLEASRSLLGADTAREFSIAQSEVVRSFIEERFQILAARRTTEEFLHELLQPSGALLKSQRVLLGSFLNHCDLAKFSRWVPSLQQMEEMHQSARAFVLEVGKPPEPENKKAKAVAKPSNRPAPAP